MDRQNKHRLEELLSTVLELKYLLD